MQISTILFVMIVILSGSCVQSALGFGSIVMVSISTLYVSLKYRESIQWAVMLPFLIPTAIITGIVNFLSAKVGSDVMYLLLGIMFVAVSIFFFVFSDKIHITPNPLSGTILGVICGICYGLFASGGPTAALYLLPATKSKKEYLATIQAFLCVNNLVVLAISLLLGRLNMADLPMVGAGIIAMLAGTLLGLVIHNRIPASVFGKVIYAFVGIGGVWIIVSHLL